MGGSDTVYSSSQQSVPSTADAVKAWVEALPQVYETQMQYNPLLAQQQVELAQQYAEPYGQAYLAAQKAMYPEEYAMKEKLSNLALSNMESGMPDWMQKQYRDTLAANIGSNAGSPIGADYMSTGMLQANEDYKNYYQNLALSLSGNQPIMQATTPTTTDYMSSFSPSSVMSYLGNNVSTTSSSSSTTNPWGNLTSAFGGLLGGLGTGWASGWV